MPQSASRLHFISMLYWCCLWITLWSSTKNSQRFAIGKSGFVNIVRWFYLKKVSYQGL